MRRLVMMVSALAACGGGGRDGSGFRIEVGALSLPGVSDARYRLEILGADGTVVSSNAAVDSDRYGDGRGSIAYVAGCDARNNPHTIELELIGLWADGEPVPDGDWIPPGVIRREAICAPDADTRVSFDLVVARTAEQGFFDVAVTFEDIFCSAKLDCQDGLLHDPSGARDETAVLGFACVAGVGQPTYLHMSDVRIVCDDGTTAWVTPSGREGVPGNMGGKPPLLFQTAVYWGHEDLPSVDKCYWNLALGLASLPGRCRVEGAATATDAPLDGGALPRDAIYPYVKWSVPLSGAEGELECRPHPLNGAGSGVTTEYARGTGGRFGTTLVCNDAPRIVTPPRLACDGRIGVVGATESVVVSQDLAGVSLIMGDARSRPYTLPDGFAVDGCCLNPCCSEE